MMRSMPSSNSHHISYVRQSRAPGAGAQRGGAPARPPRGGVRVLGIATLVLATALVATQEARAETPKGSVSTAGAASRSPHTMTEQPSEIAAQIQDALRARAGRGGKAVAGKGATDNGSGSENGSSTGGSENGSGIGGSDLAGGANDSGTGGSSGTGSGSGTTSGAGLAAGAGEGQDAGGDRVGAVGVGAVGVGSRHLGGVIAEKGAHQMRLKAAQGGAQGGAQVSDDSDNEPDQELDDLEDPDRDLPEEDDGGSDEALDELTLDDDNADSGGSGEGSTPGADPGAASVASAASTVAPSKGLTKTTGVGPDGKPAIEQKTVAATKLPEELSIAISSLRSFKHDLIDAFQPLGDDAGAAAVSASSSPQSRGATYSVVELVVQDPRWLEAMDLFEQGKCTAAAKQAAEVVGPLDALAAANTKPGILYATSRIDLCSGNRARGLKQLSVLAKAPTPIGTLASIALGRPKSNDPYRPEIHTLRELIDAQSKLARKHPDRALKNLDDLYETLGSRRDRYNVRLVQAGLLERAGRHDEAAAIYLQLYRRTRGDSANARIEDRLERLERRTKQRYLTFGERVDRMQHLIGRGRYRDAKELSIANAARRNFTDAELQGLTNFRLALVAERRRDRTDAIRLFKSAERLIKDDEVRPRIYLGWARALRRLDRDSEAIKLYIRVATEYPENFLAAESRYQAGRLLQYQDKNKEAIEQFELALATLKDNTLRDDDPSWAADALWRLSFGKLLLGKWQSAITNLERLKSRYGDERDASDLTQGLKAQYWIAVAQLRSGNRVAAQLAFQQTLSEGRLTWYGRLAAARLEEEGMSYRDVVPSMPSGFRAQTDHYTRMHDLLNGLGVEEDVRLETSLASAEVGLWRQAKEYSRRLLNAHPPAKGADALVATAALLEGDAPSAHWRMRRVIDEAGPNEKTLRQWLVAFPDVYDGLIKDAGSRYDVDPNLIHAIIRQESGFRPAVRSHAGAVGLMQLMPRTARSTAAQFMPETSYSRRALLKPETNIALGTMYIRLQTAYAMSSIPIALAAYNAGTGPQSSWLKRYGDRRLDAWVESITYSEARGYVRKVFTSYVAYSQVYDGHLPKLDLDAPQRLKLADQKRQRVWGKVGYRR